MNVHLWGLAAEQFDVVAAWQLLRRGVTRRAVENAVQRHGWRVIHPGVYALTQADLTREQRWMAAALTTPNSFLSHASAGACWGFRPFEGAFETVVRPGSGGPKRVGALLVMRSTTLRGDVTRRHGIPVTTAERTLVDLAAHLDDAATARMLREALRLSTTTAPRVLAALEEHRGRRGSAVLRERATHYASVPYARTRSDAEGRALEILLDAGERPKVNVRVAGGEADLVFPRRREIVEIDGPQYHRFPDEDERKQQKWEAAGWTVRRIGSDAVYGDAAGPPPAG